MTLPAGVWPLLDGDAAVADRVLRCARFGELLLALPPTPIAWASAAYLGADTRAVTRQLDGDAVVLVRHALAADPWLPRTVLHELRHCRQFRALGLTQGPLSDGLRAVLERDATAWAARWAAFYAQLEARWATC